jgi:hypothetical protein
MMDPILGQLLAADRTAELRRTAEHWRRAHPDGGTHRVAPLNAERLRTTIRAWAVLLESWLPAGRRGGAVGCEV